jgi:hypothetical protein
MLRGKLSGFPKRWAWSGQDQGHGGGYMQGEAIGSNRITRGEDQSQGATKGQAQDRTKEQTQSRARCRRLSLVARLGRDLFLSRFHRLHSLLAQVQNLPG